MNLRAIIAAVVLAGSEWPLAGGGPVTALVYSPDGSALISNADGGLAIRAPDDAVVRRRVPCNLRKINALTFHPSGRYFAVAGGTPGARGGVVLMSWPDGRETDRLEVFTDQATCVAFSADGAGLAVGSADHTVRVWRVSQPMTHPVDVANLEGHAGPVQAVAFAVAGTNLITAGADRSLKVWTLPNGRLVRSLTSHTEAIQALALGPVSVRGMPVGLEYCASAGLDQTVRIWQPGVGRMVRIIRHHAGAVLALAYLPDGSALYSAGAEGIIRRIDPDSDEILEQWSAHRDWIYVLSASPDGSRLASGDWAGEVRVWETRKGAPRTPTVAP